MDSTVQLSYPGQVDFQYLKLVSTNGLVIDLDDYLIEFNLFEDIFSNFLHGQILINDSLNILSRLPIRGDEMLIVSFGTPQLNAYFQKIFAVYSVTDQKTVADNNTQIYTLHFCSTEGVVDANLAIYKPFSGTISTVSKQIFDDFLSNPAYVKFKENDIEVDENTSSNLFLTETQNKIKFISPGWSPAKCLNWLASKAIPKEGKACDFLFWESTAGFFFASIEDLIKGTYSNNRLAGDYYYIPPGTFESSDIIEKLFLAQGFEVISFVDNLKNFSEGFYANRIVSYDPLKKQVKTTDFDYTTEYNTFTQTEGPLSIAPFSSDILKNSAAYTKIYPASSKLFSGINDNFPQRMPNIFGNRNTKLLELNNFKINLTVHGRSDLFVGSMIRFNYPETSPHADTSEGGTDKIFSGNYLVTAIRHKINYRTHVMVLELVKNSTAAK
jgi:hypothetical protein